MHEIDTWRAGWTGATRDAAAAERLDAELVKLGALDGEEPSWPAMREQAAAVLLGGPDLGAAACLAQAALMLDGLPGLTAGLGLLRDLLRDHWDELHPPLERQRARRAALLWLVERAARGLPANAPAAEVSACAGVAAEAAGECERRFGEALLAPLRRRLEALVGPETRADAPAAPAKPVAPGTRAEAVAHLALAAEYFQRREPHSPVGPLLRRGLAWSELGFEEVFRELLARAPEARNALWETLGLKPEPKKS